MQIPVKHSQGHWHPAVLQKNMDYREIYQKEGLPWATDKS